VGWPHHRPPSLRSAARVRGGASSDLLPALQMEPIRIQMDPQIWEGARPLPRAGRGARPELRAAPPTARGGRFRWQR
jgi:hypothetical protein